MCPISGFYPLPVLFHFNPQWERSVMLTVVHKILKLHGSILVLTGLYTALKVDNVSLACVSQVINWLLAQWCDRNALIIQYSVLPLSPHPLSKRLQRRPWKSPAVQTEWKDERMNEWCNLWMNRPMNIWMKREWQWKRKWMTVQSQSWGSAQRQTGMKQH